MQVDGRPDEVENINPPGSKTAQSGSALTIFFTFRMIPS